MFPVSCFFFVLFFCACSGLTNCVVMAVIAVFSHWQSWPMLKTHIQGWSVYSLPPIRNLQDVIIIFTERTVGKTTISTRCWQLNVLSCDLLLMLCQKYILGQNKTAKSQYHGVTVLIQTNHTVLCIVGHECPLLEQI